MSTIHLRQLSISDGDVFYNMLQHIEKIENAFTNPVNGMSFDEYLLWLKQQDIGVIPKTWEKDIY